MRRFLLLSWLVGSLLAFTSTTLPAQAEKDPPSRQLLGHVPDDVTFCVVLTDLRGHQKRLTSSPFIQDLKKDPVFAQLQQMAPEQVLKQVEVVLRQKMGVSVQELVGDLLGTSVVLAFRIDPQSDAQDEYLLILRAANEKTLTKALKQLNRTADRLDQRQHLKLSYVKRSEGKDVHYFSQQGTTFLLSGDEKMLQQSLERVKEPAKDPSQIAQAFHEAGLSKALISLWLNPRFVEQDLRQKLTSAPSKEQAFLRTFATRWASVESLVGGLEIGEDLSMSLALKLKSDSFPPGTRKFFEQAGVVSSVWGKVPENAIFAWGARLDLAALVAMITEHQNEENAKEFRAGVNHLLVQIASRQKGVTDVLPYVGPDWGAYVAPPPTGVKTWFPSMLLAIRAQPGPKKPPVDKALWGSLQGVVFLARIAYNKDNPGHPLSVETFQHGNRTVHYLASEQGRAVGFLPTYGLHEGEFVFASSPEAWKAYVTRKPKISTAEETPLIRISAKHFTAYVKTHDKALIAALAKQQDAPEDEIRQHVASVLSGLTFLDRVELTQRVRKGSVKLSLRIRFTKPLIK